MSDEEPKEELPAYVRNRIEKNRQKAIAIKQSKLVSHPYAKSATAVTIDKSTIKIGAKKFKDTGGGFLLEDETDSVLANINIDEELALFELDRPTCIKCEKLFTKSWLLDKFDYKCCDECKDPEAHKLITKSDALNAYLLKDHDLTKREPVLKFITRKNPHNVRWGDMKLYLQLQVEERALEVWGSEENIEKERETREEKKVLTKTKRYHKQMKQLRMSMRASLYDKTSEASHTHEFGPETYNEDDDTYNRCCLKCPYVENFEKM